LAELKVLFATSEVAPLIKTGGLADVSSALPAALRAIGVDVRVLVPGYSQVMAQLVQYEVAATFDALPGCPSSRLLSGKMAHDVPILVLDCPSCTSVTAGLIRMPPDRTGRTTRCGLACSPEWPPYWEAVQRRSNGALIWCTCNDWQTGLAPAYLHFAQDAAPSIIAIHNLHSRGFFRP